MAKNTQPIFTRTPLIGMAQATVINTSRDGTGTMVTVVTGDAEGTRIDLVRIVATVSTTAGMLRLFIDDGVDVRLWKEIQMTAVTPSSSVPAFSAEYEPTVPLLLPDDTWLLKAAIVKAEATNVYAFGGHFT